MKEILQTKFLNLKSTIACASAHFCIIALHVENVDQEHVTVEAEVEGAEEPEELYQEPEVAEHVEEQFSVANFPNSESQPGKPRFINPRVLHNFKLTQFSTYAYAFKFIGIV